jgi:hypothetical protein
VFGEDDDDVILAARDNCSTVCPILAARSNYCTFGFRLPDVWLFVQTNRPKRGNIPEERHPTNFSGVGYKYRVPELRLLRCWVQYPESI